MMLHAVIACVGEEYAKMLDAGFHRWMEGPSDLTIVTDKQTLPFLAKYEGLKAAVIVTDVWARNGATLNKAGAIEEARRSLSSSPHEWHAFVDADIIPPKDWWDQIFMRHDPKPGNLYGARRIVNGKPYHDGELAGFFQMFHSQDERAKPPLTEFQHAGCYDSDFMFRWPPEKRVILSIDMVHQGEPGENWWGVGNRAAMQKMRLERKKRGGWQHERLQ